MSSKPFSFIGEVVESAVIKAPLSFVWHFIKLQEFDKFWSAISKAEHVKGTSEETDIVRWTFKDGNVIEVKQDEHSNLEHFITFSVINAEPELSYSSVVNTIRLWPVTSGEFANTTFIRWSTRFSSDADLGVIEDAKYKRQDALKDLSKAAEKMLAEERK
ncbi:Bet v1-like protein [Neurospora crassa]|uniref:Bet v1-like protein n=1 Tax=Neurospora crassa (strain ATCC 24698 / 74-OR23-1A / CBS 708.71 / DSM 1257 / FGSC 987) TaxID=367110 RepID=Q7S943_NEUCR|nr:hypothetical protein NCU07273 [Neurospora crassa OR74A]EAA32891.1 hypothetical protein NCU07273 [Neurospora crassa OR74A]KHE88695.1 Bet v1-like protein [Neurospora crassa]|eukprot:XP_962127.1 hypothetical protein NCU07273 [Neurospora crassa OR74A]